MSDIQSDSLFLLLVLLLLLGLSHLLDDSLHFLTLPLTTDVGTQLHTNTHTHISPCILVAKIIVKSRDQLFTLYGVKFCQIRYVVYLTTLDENISLKGCICKTLLNNYKIQMLARVNIQLVQNSLNFQTVMLTVNQEIFMNYLFGKPIRNTKFNPAKIYICLQDFCVLCCLVARFSSAKYSSILKMPN